MAAAASTQPPQPPKLTQLLERDPYLAPFKTDFQRRYRPTPARPPGRRPRPAPRGGERRLGRARGGGRAGGDRPPLGAPGRAGGAAGRAVSPPPPSPPLPVAARAVPQPAPGRLRFPPRRRRRGRTRSGVSRRPFRWRRLQGGRSCRRGPVGPPGAGTARRGREASSVGLSVASAAGGRAVLYPAASPVLQASSLPFFGLPRSGIASLRGGGSQGSPARGAQAGAPRGEAPGSACEGGEPGRRRS